MEHHPMPVPKSLQAHLDENVVQPPLPIPDLLNLKPRLDVDVQTLEELMGLAFLGRQEASGLEAALSGVPRGDGAGPWQASLFADDLFLTEMIETCAELQIGGQRYSANRSFLKRTLCSPPTTVAGVEFRQEILRELMHRDDLRRDLEELYRALSQWIQLLKSPGPSAKLDMRSFRLDLFRRIRGLIDFMADHFEDARSGLHRLHEVGQQIQDSDEYRTLVDLLEYDRRRATLRLEVGIGATGSIRHLEVLRWRENRESRFYVSPWRRLWTQIRMAFFYAYRVGHREIFSRITDVVFEALSPRLTPLAQLLGQLEVYLTSLRLQERAREAGLEMSLPTVREDAPLELEGLFNPLLLAGDTLPRPCDIAPCPPPTTTLITGPNSGGKTRLLQALGLAQLLGQSGLLAPASSARLPLLQGMFVSLLEQQAADQAEGRLGQELLRIRTLFESAPVPSLVLLDELCSGTNPSEGTEVFSLVLELLGRLEGVAFITTHFLEYARNLAETSPAAALRFLQVELDETQRSTYRFVDGVASTSLAAVTAERMGVTFEGLAHRVEQRKAFARRGLPSSHSCALPPSSVPPLQTSALSQPSRAVKIHT